jgi:hypothetical protein
MAKGDDVKTRGLWGSRWALVVVVLVLLGGGAGCATPAVTLTSEPPGAQVRVLNETLTTPCSVRLPHGRHTARFTFDTQPDLVVEEEILVPGRLAIGTATLGRTSGSALKAVAMPFLFVGYFGTGIMSAGAQSGSCYSSSGQGGCEDLMVLACAAGGLAVGMPLHAAGEYLEEISYVKAPSVHAVFPSGPGDSALSTHAD